MRPKSLRIESAETSGPSTNSAMTRPHECQVFSDALVGGGLGIHFAVGRIFGEARGAPPLGLGKFEVSTSVATVSGSVGAGLSSFAPPLRCRAWLDLGRAARWEGLPGLSDVCGGFRSRRAPRLRLCLCFLCDWDVASLLRWGPGDTASARTASLNVSLLSSEQRLSPPRTASFSTLTATEGPAWPLLLLELELR